LQVASHSSDTSVKQLSFSCATAYLNVRFMRSPLNKKPLPIAFTTPGGSQPQRNHQVQ